MRKVLYTLAVIMLLSSSIIIHGQVRRATTDQTEKVLNGLSRNKQELTLVVVDTQVFLDVQAIDGGDLYYIIDNIDYALDCTTGDGVDGKYRVEIPQGTLTVPNTSIIYAAYSEQEDKLMLYTTPPEAVPAGYYALVAKISIKDYTTITDIDDALVSQRMTEAIEHSGRGSIAWGREKMRWLGAKYLSGIDQSLDITVNGSTEDDIDFHVTGGQVFQMHRQQLNEASVYNDSIMVVNASGDGTLTEYQLLGNLNEIHEIADGTALNSGDSFNLIIAGSANYGGENKLLVLLPTGKYTSDADAVNDINNTTTSLLPDLYNTTGYLIAKLVLKYTTTNGGTWSNLLTQSVSTWHTGWQYWDTPNYPNSYPNNYDDYLTTTITVAGATAMRMVFDEFDTEANYDYIRLRNLSGTNIFSYSGNLGAFTSANMGGNTIRVFFHSDGSVVRTGVRSNKYEYQTTASVGNAVKDLRRIPLGYSGQ